ncbi:MAG: HNH endonuclease [Pseudanabaena sp. ELA748]
MSVYISQNLRSQIESIDRKRCCYCLTTEANSGMPMTINHIQPTSKGGLNTLENLCLACRTCNEYKSGTTEAIAPLTSQRSSLFNPRQQNWKEHFQWSNDASHIEGLTAIGRATVITLRMNNPAIVATRKRWFSIGWHPPES